LEGSIREHTGASAYRFRILRAVEAWAFLNSVIRLGSSMGGASRTGGRGATERQEAIAGFRGVTSEVTQSEERRMLDPDRYDEVAEAFDRYSERTGFPITECLLEMTRVSPGDRLLDVACGSGIVTRRAAASVEEVGTAIGIDLSPNQIRVARQRAQTAGYPWAEFAVMDAMGLAFGAESFDVVVAQFPHLPDRARCIGEMVRVLKPGGRFAICNGGGGAPPWPLTDPPPLANIPGEAVLDGFFRACMAEHFPALPAGAAGNAPVRPPASDFVGYPRPSDALRDELVTAGLDPVSLWSYAYTAPFHTAEEAFEWESIRTSVYRMQTDLDPARVAAFRQEYLRAAREKLDQHGVLGLTTGALFGVGSKQRSPG
jgi:SAM-dependent methyltransferase